MKKLIAEYTKRIEELDSNIFHYTQAIRIMRGSKLTIYDNIEEPINLRKIDEGKRQILVQVIKDLEDYV
jgi:hypothetical protein